MDYADECRELWFEVIKCAVDDLDYLERMERRAGLKKHEQIKIKNISEYPPGEFLASRWFEDICSNLGADPERVRSKVAR